MPYDSTEDEIRDLAYDYSQDPKYAACSAEENWLRAERETRLFSRFVAQISESVKAGAELMTRLLTLVSGVSLFLSLLGSLFLFAYLRSVDAILPPLDSSISISVFLVAFAYCSVTSFLVAFFVYPFLIKSSDASVRRVYPVLCYRSRLDYIRQYQTYFLPFVCGTLGGIIDVLLRSRSHNLWSGALLFSGLLIGSLIESLRLLHLELAKGIALRALLSSFLASSFSLIWTLYVLLVPLWLLDREFPNIKCGFAWLLILLTFILVLLCHSVLNGKVSSFVTAVPFTILIACASSFFFLGPAFLGGFTLRLLGLGGGVPVQLFLKSPASEPKTGCLVLSSGSEIAIIIQTKGKECPLTPKYWWESSRVKLGNVENLQRSDVLRIVSVERNEKSLHPSSTP